MKDQVMKAALKLVRNYADTVKLQREIKSKHIMQTYHELHGTLSLVEDLTDTNLRNSLFEEFQRLVG